MNLVDDVTAHIRNEGGRNLDAIFCLVVLQQGCHDAGQGKSRTVQCVTELWFLAAFWAITALQAVGLIGVEIGYRRYLQPASLGLGIDFEVIADG